jgi:hypothetical protein
VLDIGGKARRKDHWEDQGVGGWTVKMVHREIGWDGMDWIYLALYMDKWRVL